eukprot:gene15810-19059_t
MKLSAKYNRVNLITSFVVLILTGLLYYGVIHFILTDKLDRDLKIEADEILDYVKTYHKLPLAGDFKDQKVEYRLLKPAELVEEHFLYTEYKNLQEKEMEPGRSLVLPVALGPEKYEVRITKSRVEAEDLIRIIFLITLGVTAVLLVSLVLINRFVLNNLWKPFYAILDQLKAFSLADDKELKPEQTKIEEFMELNRSLVLMSQRVRADYKDLKTFTDNASHEMMTPLAVVNTKLDTLLQTDSFSDQQGELIHDIYNAMGRLSKLNQTMLLLAKIENNLILDEELLNFKQLLEQKCVQFQELFQLNEIKLQADLSVVELKMSRYLADVLLNNLFTNAIRHNRAAGVVEVFLDHKELQIGNTSKQRALNVDKIFERFNKSGDSEGMGLGLAISRQICNHYKFSLQYAYLREKHYGVFMLLFSTLSLSFSGFGQTNDSLVKDSTQLKDRRNLKSFIPGAAAFGYGLIALTGGPLKNFDQYVADKRNEHHPNFNSSTDDYLRYAPFVALYGLELMGVKGKHGFADKTALMLLSGLVTVGSVNLLKKATDKERPDHSNFVSFPSGHAAIAFAGAELLNQEYGDASVWYSIGGYTIASATAVLRIYNNAHWFSDVVAGAGL